MLAFLLATTVLADWPDFSSQAVPAYGYPPIIEKAPRDARLLHVSGVIGIPSRSGIALVTTSCDQVVHATLPEARVLAADRAETLADELGLTLGKSLSRIETPNFGVGKRPKTDCDVPSLGLPPLTVVDSETFAFSSGGEFAVGMAHLPLDPIRPPPAPPQALPPPMSPTKHEGDLTVHETGYAERLSLHETLTLLVESLTRDPNDRNGNGPHSDADVAPILAAIATVRPDAASTTSFGTYSFGQRDAPRNASRATIIVAIENPRPTDATDLERVVTDAASSSNLSVQPLVSVREPRCAQLEDDARRNAIARVRNDLAMREHAGTSFRLLFVDEQPTYFAQGACGPILQNSMPLSPTWDYAPAKISAYVTLTLEFETDAHVMHVVRKP